MALVIGAAATLIAVEHSSPCPPGGPLAFGSCDRVRPFAVDVVALSAALYVMALTGVRRWTVSLVERRLADRIAARDWYLLAAAIGLVMAPLLSFTLLSAPR